LLLEERGRCQARALAADLRRLALLRRFGRLQELRCRKAEHAGEDAVREGLAARVVFHHRVVVGLARERHLVLGAGELFLQAEHVLIGFQIGVLLEYRQEPPERDDHREENPQSHGLPPYVLVPAATIARRPCARPSAVESTRPTADIAMAHTASSRACIPSARRPVTSQPPTASAPRTATMSITFFALYFSSRASTVKS